MGWPLTDHKLYIGLTVVTNINFNAGAAIYPPIYSL